MTHHHHEFDAGQLYRLQQFDRFFEAMHRQMVSWLDIAPGSRVLDAGCGGGGVTTLLAQRLGAIGQLTALDIEPQLLDTTRELLSAVTIVGEVNYEQGSIDKLPFPDGTFDLVWCSRVIHHMPDMVAAVREIRRVLKPGGRFAMREDGFLMQLLPFDIGLGEPGLDQRINAVRAWDFAQVRPSISNSIPYPFGWTQLLLDAGFTTVGAHSFVAEDFLRPLTADKGDFVVRHWRRPLEQPEARARLSLEDQRVLEQLVNPDSEHYLLKRKDLHYVKVSTVYIGQ